MEPASAKRARKSLSDTSMDAVLNLIDIDQEKRKLLIEHLQKASKEQSKEDGGRWVTNDKIIEYTDKAFSDGGSNAKNVLDFCKKHNFPVSEQLNKRFFEANYVQRYQRGDGLCEPRMVLPMTHSANTFKDPDGTLWHCYFSPQPANFEYVTRDAKEKMNLPLTHFRGKWGMFQVNFRDPTMPQINPDYTDLIGEDDD